MAATFLRLPRSANTATGMPQPIWATAPTKITAPRPASLRWKDALDLGAQDPDAVDDGVGDHGRHREQDQGREPVLAQDAHQRGRLALAGPGHEGDVGDGRLVAALADRLGEQLVGDDEIEEGLFPLEHRLLADERVPHSCDTLIPDAIVRDVDGSGPGGPWPHRAASGSAGGGPLISRSAPGLDATGERAVGEHAQPGAARAGRVERLSRPHRSRLPQAAGTRRGPRRRSGPPVCSQTSARRRTRPRTWACQRSVSDGPSTPPSASGPAASASSRAKAPPPGVPSAHSAAMTMVPPGADDALGRGHALHRLVEVAVERIPPVGAEHDVEARRPPSAPTSRSTNRHAAACPAGSGPAKTAVSWRRWLMATSSDSAGGRQGHRGPHEVVDGVALGDEPRGAGVGDAGRAVRLEDRLECGQARARPLGTAAEAGEEVGLDEAGQDADVGLDVAAVDPDGRAVDRRPPRRARPPASAWCWWMR